MSVFRLFGTKATPVEKKNSAPNHVIDGGIRKHVSWTDGDESFYQKLKSGDYVEPKHEAVLLDNDGDILDTLPSDGDVMEPIPTEQLKEDVIEPIPSEDEPKQLDGNVIAGESDPVTTNEAIKADIEEMAKRMLKKLRMIVKKTLANVNPDVYQLVNKGTRVRKLKVTSPIEGNLVEKIEPNNSVFLERFAETIGEDASFFKFVTLNVLIRPDRRYSHWEVMFNRHTQFKITKSGICGLFTIKNYTLNIKSIEWSSSAQE